ncbi:HPr family phosphocarrier protein [Priestia filamentosa]|uniref:HPr family phosphocarrier protein n=1 Tax=Priestia filamentosa TaxID=1402861 RepID=UPI0005893F96
MIEKRLKVKEGSGIHARPATKLTTTVSKFQSEVLMEYASRTVNVKSIMGVLSLAVPGGEEVVIRVKGSDEEEVVQAITELFESNFGE